MNLNITHGIRRLAIGAIAVAGLALVPAAAQASAVTAYPQERRELTGLWANEHVPAYQCPGGQRFLENRNYAPAGTSLIPGVEIRQATEPWPIGVSITKAAPGMRHPYHYNRDYGVGIGSGWDATSVTNWTFGTAWYQVILHCTDDRSRGYWVTASGEVASN